MSGAAIGRDALATSAIRWGAFFAVMMLSTLFASGAVYTIDYSVSGYKGSETLENFPVLVRLSANSPADFDYNHCAANGADVYFTDASNNVLAHEIDTWDTSGESLIWVKIPSVTPVAQSTATFTMHYGSAIPATITLPDASSVWTGAGYSGVWHFGPSEGTDSAYGTAVSSTKGTVSYTGNASCPGPLGGNLWTDVDSAVIYNYATNAHWAALGTGNTLTLTCWARANAMSGSGRMISTKQFWNQNEGFELTIQSGSSGKVTIAAAGSTQLQTTINPRLDAQWRLVTARCIGSEIRLFMDGADTKSYTSATITAPNKNLTFLARADNRELWRGGIDEVRIRPAASSADWIQAEYDSVASSTFLTGVVNFHTFYYKSGVFEEGSSDLVVVDSDGNTITLQSGDNVVFDDTVAGANAIVYFGETLPTGVTYSFSDNWTGTVLPEGVDTATTYIWTGANGDGNMNTDGNWYGNAAPSTGAAVYIPAAKTAIINNNIENFAPASITFGSGSGQVTIGGNAIEGVAAITNLSPAVQTFNAPVSGNAIDIYNTSTHCAFRGGITLGSATFSGANTEAARALAGAWTFTGGDGYTWTPVENNRVMDNSSVTVEGELLDAVNLSIDAGCVVTAATLRATGNAKSAITKTNNGSLVVTGECRIDASADCYLAYPADDSKENSATVEFGSYIANNSGGWPRINAKDIIVGAGGISIPFASGEHIAVLAGSPVLHSRTGEFSIDQSSSHSYYTAKSSNTTTIDTTQYGTEDVPAEVTINARFYKRNDNWPGGAMNVTGCGTLLFNSVSDFTGGLTVTDMATVAVNPGKQPGAGTVTVNNGATLQVAQSGTVALAGGLTLADGAALGFNFTARQTAPLLNVTDKTVTLNGNKNITVKVSAADEIRPMSGRHVLTSGGKFAGATVSLAAGAPNWAGIVSVNADGNIVLDVKPTGFRLIVK